MAFFTFFNEHADASKDDVMREWRELSLVERQRWRDEAKTDIDVLYERGLRIVVHAPTKLDGFISDLVTRPAMTVYDPTKELTQNT